MKINFNFSNKFAYTLIAILAILTVSLAVYAYNYTTAIPNPGHGGDRVLVNVSGVEKSLQQAIDDGDFGGYTGGVTNCNSVYNSMTATDYQGRTGIAYSEASYLYTPVTIPSGCISDSAGGCVIKVELYNSNGLYDLDSFDYQQKTDNSWGSSYNHGINGDVTSTNVVPSRADNALLIRDDYSHTGKLVETDASKWTIRDSTGSYGMIVWVCSESNPA